MKQRHLMARCLTCAKQHPIAVGLDGLGRAIDDFWLKHEGHQVFFEDLGEQAEQMIKRAVDMLFAPNADVKIAYGSSAAYTITLASLASDTNLVAGQEGTAVSNTSNLYLDYLIGGKSTTGTSPTAARTIEIWGYGSIDDTPTYPDVLDGTDSAETITSADIKYGALGPLATLATNNTSDRTYWMRPTPLSIAFGHVPKNHGLFVVHNTGVNLNSTGSNHVFSYTPVYATVT